MEFNIAVEKDNPLFKRKEIEGTIKTDVCPSKAEVVKELAEKYSVPEENIIVETIEGRFGIREFLLVAQLYESKEARDDTEVKPKKQREAEAKAEEDVTKATEGLESDAPAQPQEEKVKTQSDNSVSTEITKTDNSEQAKDNTLTKKENSEPQGKGNN